MFCTRHKLTAGMHIAPNLKQTRRFEKKQIQGSFWHIGHQELNKCQNYVSPMQLWPKWANWKEIQITQCIVITWTIKSLRSFLYVLLSWETLRISLLADSFMEFTTSSCAWRNFIRDAFSCIEYSLHRNDFLYEFQRENKEKHRKENH